MKTQTHFRALILSVLVLSGSALGQASVAADIAPGAAPSANQRTNVLKQLGLSREQGQQIRRLNVERKPRMEAAQAKVRNATRQLDAAIYAEQVNNAEVQARLSDLQSAQAEVARIRFTHELTIRKLLTAEQLGKFRQLRADFEKGRTGPMTRGSRGMPRRQRPVRGFMKQAQPKKD